MNLQAGTKYVMRNAQICTIEKHYPGTEEIHAYFQGTIDKTKTVHIWRPDGVSFESDLFDIIAVAQSPLANATTLHDFSE